MYQKDGVSNHPKFIILSISIILRPKPFHIFMSVCGDTTITGGAGWGSKGINDTEMFFISGNDSGQMKHNLFSGHLRKPKELGPLSVDSFIINGTRYLSYII